MAVRLVLIIIGFSFFTSCTRKDESTITLTLPPISSLNDIVISQSTGGESESPWGLTDPVNLEEINCVGVLVGGPGLDQNWCSESVGGAELFRYGPELGIIPLGNSQNTVVMEAIPSGPDRTIRIIGFKAADISKCRDMKAHPIDFDNFAPPYVIGKQTLDLDPGEVSVNIEISMSGAQKIEQCSGKEPEGYIPIGGPAHHFQVEMDPVVNNNVCTPFFVHAKDIDDNFGMLPWHPYPIDFNVVSGTGQVYFDPGCTDPAMSPEYIFWPDHNIFYFMSQSSGNGTDVLEVDDYGASGILSASYPYSFQDPPPPAGLSWSAPPDLPTNSCGMVLLEVRDANGRITRALGSEAVALSASNAGVQFFGNEADCESDTSAITGYGLSYGESVVELFVKASSGTNGAYDILAASAGWPSASHRIFFNDPAPFDRLNLNINPGMFSPAACMTVATDAVDQFGNNTQFLGGETFKVEVWFEGAMTTNQHYPLGSGCSTPVTTQTMGAGGMLFDFEIRVPDAPLKQFTLRVIDAAGIVRGVRNFDIQGPPFNAFAWYRARQSFDTDSDGLIDFIHDYGPNDINLQNNSASGPSIGTYNPSMNATPLFFNGAAFATGPTVNKPANFTIVFVGNVDNSGTNSYKSLFGTDLGGDPNTHWGLSFFDNATVGIDRIFAKFSDFGPVLSVSRNDIGSLDFGWDDVFTVEYVSGANTVADITQNLASLSIAQDATAASNNFGMGQIALGQFGAVPTNRFKGDFYELIIYDRILSPFEKNHLCYYLRDRYPSLPVSCP